MLSHEKRPTRKTVPKTKSRAKSRVVASKRSRITGRPLALVVALLFGGIGVFLLVQAYATPSDEVLLADDPARGLVYHGKKVKTKGPCAGGFDVTTEADVKKDGKDKRRCAHYDPTPPGVDIRERVKKVDEKLAALGAHDEKVKPAKSDDETSGYEQEPVTAATIWAGDMDGIGARDWPCIGTGRDGARVKFIYVYPSGGTNRLSDLRPGLSAIARRMNSIFFQSGMESGNAHQIRFATNHGDAGCGLLIAAEPIRGDMLHDYSFIIDRLRERGWKGIPKQVDLDGDGVMDYTTYGDRKYSIWVDKDTANCGLGQMRIDASPGQTNANNTSVSYAMSWKGCWNYAEPHELGHMLGAVQSGAPYGTAGHHCYDERDVMCYKDGAGVNIRNMCTRAIDWWRLDCNHNTYYRGNSPATGYLSNHWNVANSRFLTR